MPTTDLPADLVELARLLVGLPWCPWRQPGGQLRDEHGVEWVYSDEADWNAGGSGDPLPDLSDPATVGCVLALLRELTRTPGLYVRCYEPSAPDMSGTVRRRWRCMDAQGRRAQHDDHPTEAHAIIALGMAVTRG